MCAEWAPVVQGWIGPLLCLGPFFMFIISIAITATAEVVSNQAFEAATEQHAIQNKSSPVKCIVQPTPKKHYQLKHFTSR